MSPARVPRQRFAAVLAVRSDANREACRSTRAVLIGGEEAGHDFDNVCCAGRTHASAAGDRDRRRANGCAERNQIVDLLQADIEQWG